MSLLGSPQQPQRHGLLDPNVMQLIQSGGPRMAPAQARPQRDRVSGWRVLDRVLGGQTVSEGLDAERERLREERFRPQSDARRARVEDYVDRLTPDAQLAYMTARDKLGEAFASRQEGRVLDQGDIYMEGNRPAFGAPFDAAPGASVFDPLRPGAPLAVAQQENKVAGGALVAPDGRVLYRGPEVEGVAATADAFVTPEIQRGVGGGAPSIARASRPDTVTVAPGGEIVQFNPDGTVMARVASSQQRPMSDADQSAVARADNQITSLDTSLQRAAAIEQQIARGELSLGLVENAGAGFLNLTGNSNQNSLNYDALLAWAKEARNAILQANTGVQTDQDAIRELDTILSSTRDERIVTAALRRFQQARRATRGALQRDIDRRSGAQGGQASGGGSGGNAPQGGPAVGTVEGGYRFRGGNPASPSSWERVR